MWKNPVSLTASTFFSPHANVDLSILFHTCCGRRFLLPFFNRTFIHIPQTLWKNYKFTITNYGVGSADN